MKEPQMSMSFLLKPHIQWGREGSIAWIYYHCESYYEFISERWSFIPLLHKTLSCSPSSVLYSSHNFFFNYCYFLTLCFSLSASLVTLYSFKNDLKWLKGLTQRVPSNLVQRIREWPREKSPLQALEQSSQPNGCGWESLPTTSHWGPLLTIQVSTQMSCPLMKIRDLK